MVDGPVLDELKVSLLVWATRQQKHKTLQHWSGAVGGEASKKESEVKFSPGLNELSLQIYYTLLRIHRPPSKKNYKLML